MKLAYIIIHPKHFSSNEEAITSVNNYFAEKNAEDYLDGLQRWEHRWEKCVQLQVDCWKKNFWKNVISLLGWKLFRPPSHLHVFLQWTNTNWQTIELKVYIFCVLIIGNEDKINIRRTRWILHRNFPPLRSTLLLPFGKHRFATQYRKISTDWIAAQGSCSPVPTDRVLVLFR